jgi:hypothetical protein
LMYCLLPQGLFTHPFSSSDFEVWCDSGGNNSAQIVPNYNFIDGKLAIF